MKLETCNNNYNSSKSVCFFTFYLRHSDKGCWHIIRD